MAQAAIDQSKKNRTKTSTWGIQTESDNMNEMSTLLANGKEVRLHYSSIYKKRVLSLVLQSGKSFIIDRNSWQSLKDLTQTIDQFFKNGN